MAAERAAIAIPLAVARQRGRTIGDDLRADSPDVRAFSAALSAATCANFVRGNAPQFAWLAERTGIDVLATMVTAWQ